MRPVRFGQQAYTRRATMPVFHTKTIESILEPVAQQVSVARRAFAGPAGLDALFHYSSGSRCRGWSFCTRKLKMETLCLISRDQWTRSAKLSLILLRYARLFTSQFRCIIILGAVYRSAATQSTAPMISCCGRTCRRRCSVSASHRNCSKKRRRCCEPIHTRKRRVKS